MGNQFRVGVDIGGTFTDFVIQDSHTGSCSAHKVLSTPENPAEAVIGGIDALLPTDGQFDHFVHGTTVGLNALLTRQGARVGLLTTRNFRDVYTIQGNDRGEIFSIRWNKPQTLVPLEDTFTANERMAATGKVVQPLDCSDLDEMVECARQRKFEAIAIAFLFSYKNPAHELEATAYIAERLPGVTLTMSHRVSPEWREFERISTTVMDSYLAPVVRTYLNALVDQLEDRLSSGKSVFVMQSNGGLMSAGEAAEVPLQTLLSGPVGGAIGGRALAAETGHENLICVDMGGTSFDASLVIDGIPSISNETRIEGLPLQMSVVDIHVIGAGGGSIAWQEVNAVRVGPQSAGAVPGPVCYGLGGDKPTVSDANLVLGRLDGANFSGEGMDLDQDGASRVIGEMGSEFELDNHEMAQGILDIINAKMADAIRTITIRNGIDPRDFSLLAFGGAGPAQAVALAEELEISNVIIPVFPGAFSAWGMLQTDVRRDLKETLYGFWDNLSSSEIGEAFGRLEKTGMDLLVGEGIKENRVRYERGIDFRYFGQEYVLTIPVPTGPIDMEAVRSSFDRAYERQYGHSSPESRIEMANIRLAVIGLVDKPEYSMQQDDTVAPTRHREVYFAGKPRDTLILGRSGIAEGQVIIGPAIVEEATATTLVPPGWQARVSVGGHLMLTETEADK